MSPRSTNAHLRAADVAGPPLDPNKPTVQIKRGKKKPVIVNIAILIG